MNALGRTILQRLALGLMSIVIVSVVVFSSLEFLPGDFASSVLGRSATPETVAAFRQELGLDLPAVQRYFHWIGGVLQGDLGNSFAGRAFTPRPVSEIVMPRLWNTLFLAGITAAIAIPVAVLLGLLAALYRNSRFDRLVNASTLSTIAMPEFLVAYMVILALAVKFPLFYAMSTLSPGMSFTERLGAVALPVLTLSLVIIAHMMRMTRAAIIGVLASPYIEMARLKGMAPWRIITRHALPNALGPIVNVIAFSLAYLVVGVVVIEVVFVYPGIGQTMVDAVRNRDIPVVQACALIFAATYIVLNLIADIIAIATNPRLLHAR
ncbi:ABC transporter permease [Paracoccus sulfuroxidans]|uniref:Peptide/nickel transport system permease protein n=1 Tax=Paracoccus sulfuroxidans TaxID=384678 RepID=A0A562NHL5_9RHOB|nr:ABC transporter permease [Paracoccus sulfuroxidans]TWI31550.1 peptide/nickel transport system permease protein [Paracoccus sulfuroxidans]